MTLRRPPTVSVIRIILATIAAMITSAHALMAQALTPCHSVITKVNDPIVQVYKDWPGPKIGDWDRQRIPVGTVIDACSPNGRYRITVGIETVWIDSYAVQTVAGGAQNLPPPPGLVPPLGGAVGWLPTRPVTVVAATVAGSPIDVIARVLSDQLSQTFHQTFIVEDIPGAAGLVGLQRVANSPPDGYTLLLGSDTTLVINPNFNPRLAEPIREIVPVASLVTVPYALVANRSLPVNTVKEFIDLARRDPGKLVFGTVGTEASRLTAEMFQSAASVKLTSVPFRGSGPAISDLSADMIQAMFLPLGQALPLARSGQVKLLAVASSHRLPQAPDVPTITESGLNTFTSESWLGLFAPRGVSREVVATLNVAVKQIISTPAFRTRALDPLAIEPYVSSPEGFTAAIKADTEKWSRVARDAGIKAQ